MHKTPPCGAIQAGCTACTRLGAAEPRTQGTAACWAAALDLWRRGALDAVHGAVSLSAREGAVGSYRRFVAEGGAHSHGNRAKGRPGGAVAVGTTRGAVAAGTSISRRALTWCDPGARASPAPPPTSMLGPPGLGSGLGLGSGSGEGQGSGSGSGYLRSRPTAGAPTGCGWRAPSWLGLGLVSK